MIEMDVIRKTVIEIIVKNIGKEHILSLEPDCELSKLGMTSIVFIQIVVSLEETFDIEIPDEKLIMTEMGTVNKIINVVKEVLKSKEYRVEKLIKNM